MLELGTPAPDFTLPNTNPPVGSDSVALAEFQGAKALLVIFMCNHCPYVIHIRDALTDLVREYQEKGVAAVAISANDVTTHPDDSPRKMTNAARKHGFTFPYLYDETQAVAKAYHAACTPDFFLFDGDGKLFYRGRFDKATPGNQEPIDGADLRAAIDAVLSNQGPPADQHPSMGCNIKWKAGGEPAYSGAD
jgi:peroxiredoxin